MAIFLAIAYLVLAALAALIADRKGRGGGMFFIKLVGGTLALDLIAAWAMGGANGLAHALIAFACVGCGLLLAVFGPDTKRLAVQNGQHGEYKKCPFCAEPVRKEAVKCKHCQTDLPSADLA